MDKILKEQILNHAEQSMELNPDRGAITAVKDAADFHDVDLSETEIETLAFELLFDRKDTDF
jgi:rRNA maturation endonuclease Nob1